MQAQVIGANMKKDFLQLIWAVVDSCNLNCPYCINSCTPKAKEYTPGIEIAIAKSIVKISEIADRVAVTLSGGEPLLAQYITDVISILSSKPNIKVGLITNLILIEKIQAYIPYLSSITVSLHIKLRSAQDIDRMIKQINRLKKDTTVILTQLDYKLTMKDILALVNISSATGLSISFQTFVPPWTEYEKTGMAQKISDSTYVKSLGKRCVLGYSHFLIQSDGYYRYGLWCFMDATKKGNFTVITPEVIKNMCPAHMGKCQKSSCGCNHSVFAYDEYKRACKRLGYGKEETFGRYHQRIWPRLRVTTKLIFFKAISKSYKFMKLFR